MAAKDLPGFYASRPVIRIDGTVEPALGDALLISLLVEETTLGLFRCEARLRNWGPKDDGVDFLLFDLDTVDFGKEITVELGPAGGSREVFVGRISGIETHCFGDRAPELTLLAEDRFQDLRMARRTRSFENVSDEDVVREVARAHSLDVQIDVDSSSYPVLVQLNQSDLAFLRERATAIDAELWLEDDTLHFVARSRRDAGRVSLTYGASLLEFSALADLAHQRSRIRVTGWDVANKAALEAEAAEDAITGELGAGQSGSAILGRALKEHTETVVVAVPLSFGEAQALAQARYRGRARRFVRGTAVAEGTAAIRVGTTVELRGLGPLFSGDFDVVATRHSFDAIRGYRTAFEVGRPGLGA